MSYNVSFSIAAAIIGVILIFIMSINYSSSTLVNKRFKLLLIVAILMTIMDVVTVYTNDHAGDIPLAVNYVLNSIYFFLGALTGYFLLYYSVTAGYSDVKEKTKKVFGVINTTILGIYLITLIINGFTGVYFSFDNGKYTHGSLYLLVNNCALLYVIESVVMFIIRRKRFSTKQVICSFLFFATFATCFILQVAVFNNVLLSDFGTILGALIVFFSIETPDYVKLMQTMQELNDLKSSLEEQVENRTEELNKEKQSYEELTLETLSALAELVDAKDHYTNGHSFRVAAYARGLAIKLGIPEIETQQLYFAGLIHDVGKVGVSDELLRKPEKLTKEEYEAVKAHASIGGNILKGIKRFKVFEEVARYHHEKYDGTGYPDQLKGDDIPYAARIVAVCDAFDAMTSDRSYRKALKESKAIEELERVKGSQLDPDITNAFLELCKSYPDSIKNHIDELKYNI